MISANNGQTSSRLVRGSLNPRTLGSVQVPIKYFIFSMVKIMLDNIQLVVTNKTYTTGKFSGSHLSNNFKNIITILGNNYKIMG
jgi:hypothetical protein|uniref:Uncharacterized protein n=1 Tax=Populus trichocarpa TaxID=3694 RepID=A0A2K2AH97_POPTR